METARDTAVPHRPDPLPSWVAASPVKRLWPALLPELRQFPEADRDRALQQARETALDVVELVGMAVGLVVVTALTKYSVPDASMASRFALALVNFAVALPLLVAVLGPFHLRRLRRGLREQLRQRGRR
ncbi:MAG: hypothetical protein U1F56_06805 [Rubrivivax sp.]